MLKDITLGQFFPGNSLIHRLDPRTKLLLLIGFIVGLFLCESYFSYGLALVFLGCVIALSRIRLKALFKGMKTLLIIIIFTALLNRFQFLFRKFPMFIAMHKKIKLVTIQTTNQSF